MLRHFIRLVLGDQWASLLMPLDASLVSAAPYELGRINSCKCDALWLEINRLHFELSLDAKVGMLAPYILFHGILLFVSVCVCVCVCVCQIHPQHC